MRIIRSDAQTTQGRSLMLTSEANTLCKHCTCTANKIQEESRDPFNSAYLSRASRIFIAGNVAQAVDDLYQLEKVPDRIHRFGDRCHFSTGADYNCSVYYVLWFEIASARSD